MKLLIKMEEGALLLVGIYLFLQLPISGWWFLVFFLAPDISMLGYLWGPRIGAFCYNWVHHRAPAVLLLLLGLYFQWDLGVAIGSILFSHIAFDRMLGYGLKYPDSFKNTHLGTIGKPDNS
jgi:hypothetical protein